MKLDEDELNFIPFDHTLFSTDNLKSMAMLIILFERYLNFDIYMFLLLERMH